LPSRRDLVLAFDAVAQRAGDIRTARRIAT